MIFKQDDIAIFSHLPKLGDTDKIEITRFHKPTGVYFSVINRTQGFEYFEVAQLNSKGEKIDKKTFDGKNQKSFFEAVDYFEELVAKREPQPEQEDPSVGIFVFLKKRDSVAEVFGNKVLISRKDVEKVFTPPVKKKYGRLNMYAVDDSRYDVIKGKFALNFDEDITNSIAKQLGLTPNEDVFAYKMTPYDTSQDGQSDDTPQDVNDDNLNINDIEGEDPQNMTGDNAEPQDGQDGDGQDGDGQDGDGQDGDGQDGKDGDGQDGDGQDGDGQDGDGQDGDGQDGDGQDGDGQDGDGQDGDGQDGDAENTREVIARQPQNAVEAIEDLLNLSLKTTYRKKGRIGRVLGAFNKEELQPMYEKLNVPITTSKEEFIKTISEITDNYLGNE